METDEEKVLLLISETIFIGDFFLRFAQTVRGDRQGRTPSVSHLSRKIQNKLHDTNCLEDSSTQPRRDYHIARICLQRALMHSETQFSTQVPLPSVLYVNLYAEGAFRLVTSKYSSRPMKYLWRKILLFDMSLQSFSIRLKLESAPSCQSLRKKGWKRSKSVGVMSFQSAFSQAVVPYILNTLPTPDRPQPVRQWEVWL